MLDLLTSIAECRWQAEIGFLEGNYCDFKICLPSMPRVP